MNILKSHRQEVVISALVEGASIRSVERMTGVHRDTIMRLMVKVGQNCQKIMNSKMRNLKCERLQMDELWCFVGKKQRYLTDTDNRNELGDTWIFVALDADSKLIPAYRVGKRTAFNTHLFLRDLSSRLANRIQLSSDTLPIYIDAVRASFGTDIDYGQIVKTYEAEPLGAGRYSPPRVVKADKFRVSGQPERSHISTSYVERHNLTMRMQMRRLTRLTNGFSKKLDNLKAAMALHFAHYNFIRVHSSLRATPAMAAGITDHVWEIEEIL